MLLQALIQIWRHGFKRVGFTTGVYLSKHHQIHINIDSGKKNLKIIIHLETRQH
jgi:hypothetical protein